MTSEMIGVSRNSHGRTGPVGVPEIPIISFKKIDQNNKEPSVETGRLTSELVADLRLSTRRAANSPAVVTSGTNAMHATESSMRNDVYDNTFELLLRLTQDVRQVDRHEARERKKIAQQLAEKFEQRKLQGSKQPHKKHH